MPAVSTFGTTGNAYVDGVLSGTKWAVHSFTYSFPTLSSFYGTGYGAGEPNNGFEALNTTQQTTVRKALGMYGSVANLSFTEITETATQHADLRFAESDLPSTAWAYYPTSSAVGGDAWFNHSSTTYDAPARGNYAFDTFIHEIGHAFGLKHPQEVDGAFNAMPVNRDSMEYTVMSYRSYEGASTTAGYTNETWGFAQSLMMYDIAGLQSMYGANYGTNAGDTVYSWSPTTGEMFINGVGQGAPGGNRIFLSVWDGGGSDTYDLSGYSTNLTVDLEPGAWTITSNAQRAKLTYTGSQLADGNIANALLYGGDVRSLIENAIGGSADDVIIGNQAANTLRGGAGNDQLTGGMGNDVLDGGVGLDTAVYGGQRGDYDAALLDNGWLRIQDHRAGAPDGIDLLLNIESVRFADHGYTIQELLQSVTVPGVFVTGDEFNNVLQGTAGNDTLCGFGGDDILDGGAADDTLDGGAGADKLYGRGGHDLLLGGAGNDVLGGEAGDDTLAGGDGADLLDGGDGADKLYGEGGNDLMIGGAGDDRMGGGGGNDILGGGDGNDLLEGNEDDDILYGENGDDLLIGGGGADVLAGGLGDDVLGGGDGNDHLEGGEGRDTLLGEGGNDVLIGAGGNDVIAGGGGDDVLGAGDGDDYLEGGDGDDKLYGESGNDLLLGGNGNDLLNAGDGDDKLSGGGGTDWLAGGSGRDTFVFDGTFGADTIADFDGSNDTIIVAGVSSFNDVLDRATDVGSTTVITFDGGNSITLLDMPKSALQASWFGL